nr:PAS domain S-box protein [Nostoc sp. NIES-3756]
MSQFYLDRSKDAIFFINTDAQFVYVNEATCQTLGYSREQMLAMTVPDVDPNFTLSVWQSKLPELRKKDSYHIETIHITQDGRHINVKVQVNYIQFKGQGFFCSSALYLVNC